MEVLAKKYLKTPIKEPGPDQVWGREGSKSGQKQLKTVKIDHFDPPGGVPGPPWDPKGRQNLGVQVSPRDPFWGSK